MADTRVDLLRADPTGPGRRSRSASAQVHSASSTWTSGTPATPTANRRSDVVRRPGTRSGATSPKSTASGPRASATTRRPAGRSGRQLAHPQPLARGRRAHPERPVHRGRVERPHRHARLHDGERAARPPGGPPSGTRHARGARGSRPPPGGRSTSGSSPTWRKKTRYAAGTASRRSSRARAPPKRSDSSASRRRTPAGLRPCTARRVGLGQPQAGELGGHAGRDPSRARAVAHRAAPAALEVGEPPLQRGGVLLAEHRAPHPAAPGGEGQVRADHDAVEVGQDPVAVLGDRERPPVAQDEPPQRGAVPAQRDGRDLDVGMAAGDAVEDVELVDATRRRPR